MTFAPTALVEKFNSGKVYLHFPWHKTRHTSSLPVGKFTCTSHGTKLRTHQVYLWESLLVLPTAQNYAHIKFTCGKVYLYFPRHTTKLRTEQQPKTSLSLRKITHASLTLWLQNESETKNKNKTLEYYTQIHQPENKLWLWDPCPKANPCCSRYC